MIDRKVPFTLAAALLSSSLALGQESLPGSSAAAESLPRIQVALLLDNSGSMSGLIEQAKAQLWKFVNEFATSRKEGKAPIIEVALYTYGSPPPRQLVTLTNDLDRVSEELFAVRISGGTEYCGMVIQEAVEKLPWSERSGDLKVIFIAGNEPFSQGPVPYASACKAAIERGIIVNTIHCGSGIPQDWKDGALLADGSAMSINHHRKVPDILAPQDPQIVRLGKELNRTYVAYGKSGLAGSDRQAAQDKNAASVNNDVNVQRAVAKSQVQYRNDDWDLVDAVKNGKVKLEDVKKEDLPEELQKMSLEERQAHLEKQAKKRAELQKKIQTLNKEREKYVAAELRKLSEKGLDTLDAAMIESLRKQASARNFQVKKPEPAPAAELATEKSS